MISWIQPSGLSLLNHDLYHMKIDLVLISTLQDRTCSWRKGEQWDQGEAFYTLHRINLHCNILRICFLKRPKVNMACCERLLHFDLFYLHYSLYFFA